METFELLYEYKFEEFYSLLRRGEIEDINLQDERDETLLFPICKFADRIDPELLEKIMEKMVTYPSIDLNVQNEDGDTALMYCVLNETTIPTQYLLKQPSIDINIQSTGTALDAASTFNRTNNIGNFLLILNDSRCDPNLQDNSGDTSLMNVLTSLTPNLEKFKYLCKDSRVNVNIQNARGETALFLCAKYGDKLKFVKALLKRKDLDVNLANNNFDYTPLIRLMITKSDYDDVLILFLNDPRTDVNAQDYFGATALMTACANRKLDAIASLIPYSDCNIQDDEGNVAIEYFPSSEYDTYAFERLVQCTDLRLVHDQTLLNIIYSLKNEQRKAVLEASIPFIQLNASNHLGGLAIERIIRETEKATALSYNERMEVIDNLIKSLQKNM